MKKNKINLKNKKNNKKYIKKIIGYKKIKNKQKEKNIHKIKKHQEEGYGDRNFKKFIKGRLIENIPSCYSKMQDLPSL